MLWGFIYGRGKGNLLINDNPILYVYKGGKMTKDELSQLHYLKREIKRDLSFLKELESKAYGCSFFMAGMPKSKSIRDRVGDYSSEVMDLKEKINENISRCRKELKKINSFIDSIAESEIRQLFYLRYVRGFSWQKIALQNGYCDESVPRKRHDRYLKRLEQKKKEK